MIIVSMTLAVKFKAQSYGLVHRQKSSARCAAFLLVPLGGALTGIACLCICLHDLTLFTQGIVVLPGMQAKCKGMRACQLTHLIAVKQMFLCKAPKDSCNGNSMHDLYD